MLKIDRAFVDGLEKNDDSRTIIRAVISLGRALGLKLVAEGVENAEQQRELCAYGCDMLQGYYFYRPLVEAEFANCLTNQLAEATPAYAAPLYFVLYISRATVPFNRQGLEGLRRKIRRNNRRAGVSGCLLYMDGEFMQMLEGKRDELQKLIETIRTDPLHTDLRVVIEGPTHRRVFSDWGMVVRDFEAESERLTPAVLPGGPRRARFAELAEDPRLCYAFITAHALDNGFFL